MTKIKTESITFLADTLTPVSVYLRIRDLYPGSILLESTDFHHLENCKSFICLDPLAGITVDDGNIYDNRKGERPKEIKALPGEGIPSVMERYFSSFSFDGEQKLNSFFGYMGYDSVKYFETVNLRSREEKNGYPEIRFDLYRFIVAFNHIRNEVTLLENRLKDDDSGLEELRSVIFNNKVGVYSFQSLNNEESNINDNEYMDAVDKAKEHCHRGDVFQLVLSRRFSQEFRGDEFNVYRCLRSLNPSPYLFYFDYGSYKIFGSSPESQIVITDGRAYINPIAGTFGRTGDDEKDKELSLKLAEDPKENAEHVMLVDLARNDLSRNTTDVRIDNFREIHFYSHVIHIVSKVSGSIKEGSSSMSTITDSFPAGTLSGAPKFRAMELIDEYEKSSRGFYGGCIGLIGVNGEANLAITIRSFMSMNNRLFYQAGAGIVSKSDRESELKEVNNKLGALKAAIEMANEMKN